MAVFTIVKKQPESQQPKTYVIYSPNFFEEIKKSNYKKPRSNVASINYLRDLVINVGNEYYGDDFDMFKIPVSRYKGVPVETDEQVHDVLTKMMINEYPDMNDRYVEKHIIARPTGTQLIYFLGDVTETKAFKRHGIIEVEPKHAAKELKVDKAFKSPNSTGPVKTIPKGRGAPKTPHDAVTSEKSEEIILPKTMKDK